MGTPYVGEIRIFAGNFAPVGWMFCEGQTLPISENEVLFNLIGTTYGGDGESTFNLPDLRGRVPIHQDSGSFILAQTGGVETVTLTANQIPAHTHLLSGTTAFATSRNPGGAVLAQGQTIIEYLSEDPFATLDPSAISSVGGSQPHENFQPYLCVNFIISLFGIFPSQT